MTLRITGCESNESPAEAATGAGGSGNLSQYCLGNQIACLGQSLMGFGGLVVNAGLWETEGGMELVRVDDSVY